ncbi:MAG: NADPH:quinone oxidoreductase family protein [Rhodospirillales bacterium]|nr:NADPH:quinone oxidoreductase family protein [Rhodospirillales bacterium]
MRAMICAETGREANLSLHEIARPDPGPDEVLIRVRVAGVNFADSLMLAGRYQDRPEPPFAPGLEAAGEVAALGSTVKGWKEGDRVLAFLDHGGFADYVVARAQDLHAIPSPVDDPTAAALGIAYGTAHGSLVWRARLQPEEWLAVHGAAGGTGLASVEVGKALNARVIATAGSPEKLAVAATHGADALIDYRKEDLRDRIKALTAGQGADVILDPVGGAVFEASLRALAFEGRLLTLGFAGGSIPQAPANIVMVKNISVAGFYWGAYRRRAPARVAQQMRDLFAWLMQGRLQPLVSHRLPLEEGAAALDLLRRRKATGKVVLETGG